MDTGEYNLGFSLQVCDTGSFETVLDGVHVLGVRPVSAPSDDDVVRI